MIELAGRTCYKSTDKITEDNAKPFVDRMIASKHTAMLEHGTVYLAMPMETIFPIEANGWGKYRNKYSKAGIVCEYNGEQRVAVTTNLRVIVENGWLDDLQYICEPTEYHERRYSFKLTTSIGVTRELNRHRVNSIAEQSTRYCNYSKDKFGGEVAFCIPSWLDVKEGSYTWDQYFGPYRYIDLSSPVPEQFIADCFCSEKNYLDLIEQGWVPQQAREVLPLCTATEIVHTAFASDWRFFFDLRLFGNTGKPHPNMLQLAELMKAEAEKQGIWDDIMKYPSKFE